MAPGAPSPRPGPPGRPGRARGPRRSSPVADGAMVVIKEVNGSHASDLVMTLLPRSRMLFLVRDGRDVVDSLLAAYAPGGFLARNQGQVIDYAGRARARSRLGSAAVGLQRRRDAQGPRPACARTSADRSLRGPDRRPAHVDRTALRVARSPRSDAWLRAMVTERSFGAVPEHRRGAGRRHRAATPGLWRENLTADEQALVTEIMGPRLERLGYEA